MPNPAPTTPANDPARETDVRAIVDQYLKDYMADREPFTPESLYRLVARGRADLSARIDVVREELRVEWKRAITGTAQDAYSLALRRIDALAEGKAPQESPPSPEPSEPTAEARGDEGFLTSDQLSQHDPHQSTPEWASVPIRAGRVRRILAEIRYYRSSELTAKVDALEKFKAYVHKRFDDAGVSTHPDGPHSKEGCRIGDRLDIALAGRADLLAKIEGVRRELSRIEREARDNTRYGPLYDGRHQGVNRSLYIFSTAFPEATSEKAVP